MLLIYSLNLSQAVAPEVVDVKPTEEFSGAEFALLEFSAGNLSTSILLEAAFVSQVLAGSELSLVKLLGADAQVVAFASAALPQKLDLTEEFSGAEFALLEFSAANLATRILLGAAFTSQSAAAAEILLAKGLALAAVARSESSAALQKITTLGATASAEANAGANLTLDKVLAAAAQALATGTAGLEKSVVLEAYAQAQANTQALLFLEKQVYADFGVQALAGFDLEKISALSMHALVTSDASAGLRVLAWTISLYRAYAVPAVAIAYVPIESYAAKVPAQVYQAIVPVDESTATV